MFVPFLKQTASLPLRIDVFDPFPLGKGLLSGGELLALWSVITNIYQATLGGGWKHIVFYPLLGEHDPT